MNSPSIYAQGAKLQVDQTALHSFLKRRMIQCGIAAQDAPDLATEAFLAITKDSHEYHPSVGTIEAWANGYVRLATTAYHRKKAQRAFRQIRIDAALSIFEEREEEHPILDAIQRALGDLEPEDQQILFMRFGRDLSAEKIGAELGVTPVAARKRLSRAVERLRRNPGLREAFGPVHLRG